MSLTCFLLVWDKPAGMLIFALGVAMVTTVMQREAQPYLDPWLASLSNLAHWQIVLCCVTILLVHSDMVENRGDLMGVGMLLLAMNTFLMVAIFTDTKATLKRMAKVEALVAKRAAEAVGRRGSMMGWVGGGGGTGTGGGSGRAGERESAQVEMSELSWGDTKSPWARRRGGSDDIVDNRGAEAMVQEDEDQDNSLSAVNPMAAGRDRKSSVQFDNPLVKRGGGSGEAKALGRGVATK